MRKAGFTGFQLGTVDFDAGYKRLVARTMMARQQQKSVAQAAKPAAVSKKASGKAKKKKAKK